MRGRGPGRIRWLAWRGPAVILLGLAAFAPGWIRADDGEEDRPEPAAESSGVPFADGTPWDDVEAPPFTYRGTDGKAVKRQALLGRPVFLLFAAESSTVSAAAVPALEAIQSTYPAGSVTVALVFQGGGAAKARGWATAAGRRAVPVWLDPDREDAALWCGWTLDPRSESAELDHMLAGAVAVIDAGGVVRHFGPVEQTLPDRELRKPRAVLARLMEKVKERKK